MRTLMLESVKVMPPAIMVNSSSLLPYRMIIRAKLFSDEVKAYALARLTSCDANRCWHDSSAVVLIALFQIERQRDMPHHRLMHMSTLTDTFCRG